MVKKIDKDAALSKSIDTLIKRVGWHVQANDAKGVFEIVEQIHDLEAARINELPEKYRADLLDNLEFQRFALYNSGSPFIEAITAMSKELSTRLIRTVVIQEDDTEQAGNVLQQYFFETYFGDRILVDSAGNEHVDWRSMCKKADGPGCCRLVDIKDTEEEETE